MTYEERLIRRAKLRCDRLYISELISASAALIIMLLYIFIRKYELLFISACCFLLCALIELAILVIERKTEKHIERRLRILNKSLSIRLRRFPRNKLKIEKREFEKEYGFLEEK